MDKLVIGCGYLGRRVAALWHVAGDRVFATTRSAERAAEFRALGWVPVVCNVLEPESLVRLPRVDAVVYCIGFDRSAGATKREIYVQGLRNVLDRLPAPGRFLYVSSTGVYGATNGGELDESAPTEPLDESGRIVLEAEQIVRQRLPAAVILRFAGIYGPGRGLRQKALTAAEPIAADPDHMLNLIHVEDGAVAVVAAAERARPGEIYNICDGHPVTRGEFYRYMAEVLNAPAPRFAPPEGDSARRAANRRIVNRKMLDELNVSLRYPSYVEGLAPAHG